MDIQLGRSKTVRRAYGIDEIALVPGGRTVDPDVTDTRWSLGGIEREIPIIASAMDGVVDVAGNSDGETFKLSCFDGAHAFLFHGRLRADASIEGDFWSSDSWHERWTGAPDKDAALADGWGLTKWRADADLSLGKYRDLNGQRHAITDPPFAGKVRVLEVFGSWCPNCHDHGEYMAELSRRYRGKNLQVIGLAFEHDDNFARCARQVEAFAKRHNAEFPILIAGLSNKSRASESLRLVDRIRSFPTTIFIDKHDQVRGIYQGWSGPATGDAHKRLRQRFESLIDSLLGED